MSESKLTRISSKIRQYGFFVVLKRLLKKFFKKIGFFHENYFLCIRKIPDQLESVRAPEGYSAKELSIEDLLQHSAIYFSAQKIEVFKQRFACPNYAGIGIFADGKMICFGWVSYKTVEVPFPDPDNDTLALGENEAYIVDVFTHPEHRGKGINPYCTYQLFNLIKRSHRTTAITIVDKDNKAARNTFRRCGFVVKKKIEYKSLFGKVTCHSEPSTEQL